MNTKKVSLTRCAGTVAILGLCASAVFPSDDVADIAETRAILEKWVDTRRVISAERNDWKLAREILASRVEVLQREIDSLKSRIVDAQSSIAEADKKREALVEDNARLVTSSEALGTVVTGFETRTRTLLARLPDPIRDRVKPLSQRLPDGKAPVKTPLGERFQNVVGILNEVDKFQRDITLSSEVRQLGDGTTAEVTAIYLGIAQGYYVTANGKSAGVGTAGVDGWAWTPANDAAPRIARSIAILKNEGVAEFVPLPMRIQ